MNTNIRKHGNNYQINYCNNGNRHYETFKTKTDAEARLREVRKGLSVSKTNHNSDLILLEFVKSQLPKLDNLKGTTLASYESNLANYILPLLGEMRLSEIRPPVVQQFIDDLVSYKLSPKTIKNIFSVLSRMMNRAFRLGLIDYNPCTNAGLPTVHPYQQTQVLDDDYEHFLKLCKEAHDGELYIIALTTGLRLGELIGLMWQDIDFKECTIHVCRQLQRNRTTPGGKYEIYTLKTYKERTFKVARTVINILDRIRRAQEYLRAQGELDNAEGFVFVGADGTHLKKSTVDKHFRKFVKSHPELPQSLRFHDLRGSHVTRSLDLDVNPKTVSHDAGHFSVGFTMDKYARVSKHAETISAEKQEEDLARLLA